MHVQLLKTVAFLGVQLKPTKVTVMYEGNGEIALNNVPADQIQVRFLMYTITINAVV